MDFFNDLIAQLTSLGPEALVGLIIIVAGYVIRLLPWPPGRWIPVLCLVLGAVLYPLLAKPGPADLAVRHPAVRQVLVGFLIGFLSWIGHNKFLAPLETKLPWLQAALDSPPKS